MKIEQPEIYFWTILIDGPELEFNRLYNYNLLAVSEIYSLDNSNAWTTL